MDSTMVESLPKGMVILTTPNKKPHQRGIQNSFIVQDLIIQLKVVKDNLQNIFS